MNVIDVGCPQCDAAVGYPCMKPKRDGMEQLQDFHDSRVKHRDSVEKYLNAPLAPLPEDEPYFVLRAQDVSSAQLIQLWISLNQTTAPPDKLKSAEEMLQRFRDWPRKRKAD